MRRKQWNPSFYGIDFLSKITQSNAAAPPIIEKCTQAFFNKNPAMGKKVYKNALQIFNI